MKQRSVLTSLAVLAAVAFGAAGCTAGNGSANPSNPASGIEVLNAAAAKTQGKSYQFVVAYGTALTGEGVSSGDGSATSLKVTIADAASGVVVKADAVVLTDTAYAKVDLGPMAGVVPGLPTADTWMHIDPAKAPGAARLGIKPGQDLFGPQTYIKGVTAATATSATKVTGTVDLGRAVPAGVNPADVAKLPAAARLVPFTATLDDQGRIMNFVLKLPAIGVNTATDLTSTWSNWGAPVNAVKPATSVEAPALLYAFLS